MFLIILYALKYHSKHIKKNYDVLLTKIYLLILMEEVNIYKIKKVMCHTKILYKK